MKDCPDCTYAKMERAGMLMEAGHTIAEADRLAAKEACQTHRGIQTAAELFFALKTRHIES